jgi:hypothetical protein
MQSYRTSTYWACVLLVCLLAAREALGRPFNQQKQQRRREQRSEEPAFPTTLPTDSNRLESCTEIVTETYANGTYKQTVERCCEGRTGKHCDELKAEVPEQASGEGKADLDSLDPCKNLECHGVVGAQCLTITKCGERWPVFLMADGTLAECTNGQPVNVTRLTCTERCTTDPCAGLTCSAFPSAFCVHTACDCNEPMWLLDSGVQVDCETGEHLSPEEAKERRRRRKRQAENSAPTPPPCS